MKLKRVLFVCLGNICRSPAAEGIFQDLVEKSNLADQIIIDSAGTIGNHQGQLPDKRMRERASLRGIELKSLSRKFDPTSDFDHFDFIITMDNSNYSNILEFDPSKKYHYKVKKMADYCQSFCDNEIPDPYFGGDEGFDHVLDLVTDGSVFLLKEIRELL